MKTPFLKPCLSAVAIALLGISSACKSDSSSHTTGSAGTAAKGGSGGKAGSNHPAGGAGGSGGSLEDGGPLDDGGTAATGGNGGKAGTGGSKAGSGGAAANGGSGGAAAGSGGPDLSGELFDPDVLQRFDITLPAASVTALGTAPGTYTHASLKYKDTTLADVAVKIKGESSLRPLTKKAAFKLKLDEYTANQTLLGMKRITLNNMVSDRTFMAECLAYTVYRAANLPAPRCNHAIVYVNDEFYGVYTNVESEDKTFLKRWFSNVDGNLYEDGQSDFLASAENTFDLQTNETKNDRSDLTALIAALDAAKSDTYLSDLDSILDTKHYLRFTAVEAAVDQWDGYSYTYYEPNNYRIYHDPSTGKFTFIPWGHDLSMKAFGDNPETPGAAPELSFIPLFNRPYYEGKAGARDAGGRIFVGDRVGDRASGGCLDSSGCKTDYASVVREVMSIYDNADLGAAAAKIYNQIKPYVYMESDRREISNDDFEAAYTRLLTHISKRTQAMETDMTAAGYTK